jgi:hypothetical protein
MVLDDGKRFAELRPIKRLVLLGKRPVHHVRAVPLRRTARAVAA